MTSSPARRILLFELDTRGHHPGYLQHLVKYWNEKNLTGQLDILVSQAFLQQHANIVVLAEQAPQGNVRFVGLRDEEEALLFDSAALEGSFKGRIVRAFQEWKLLRRYAKALQADVAFLMYLDTLLLRFAFGGSLPCPLSAIYFRPLLHYPSFPQYQPQGREALWQWRDRRCLPPLLRHPQLQTLFCLDPFAADYINTTYNSTKALPLPDPVQIYPSNLARVAELTTQLQVPGDRQVFLLFGVLTERKGVNQVLEAIAQLPPTQAQKLCLLLVGPAQPEDRANLEARIAELQQTSPAQIRLAVTFVRDEDIQNYFELADVILAPYQRHVGMSAILVRAAAAQKPVLSSDFGLMGQMVQRHQLGLAVDSTQAEAIASALLQFLQSTTTGVHPCGIGNPDAMAAFAEQNTASKFAQAIFSDLEIEAPSLTLVKAG